MGAVNTRRYHLRLAFSPCGTDYRYGYFQAYLVAADLWELFRTRWRHSKDIMKSCGPSSVKKAIEQGQSCDTVQGSVVQSTVNKSSTGWITADYFTKFISLSLAKPTLNFSKMIHWSYNVILIEIKQHHDFQCHAKKAKNIKVVQTVNWDAS